MESLGALLPFVIILFAFYLLMIRPYRKQQREQSQLQRQLAVGQQVVTKAGLYGTVAGVDDDSVTIEVSPGVRTRWALPAVARIVPEQTGAPEDGGDTTTDRPE